ncbi:NAD(+) diphosphatase [Acidisoma silvae]|uniref:NAD(+) diphosphatase n=1 Tax=Acidisoma silvae TaxID=2802396 RepID=A0A963YNN8_9PROT|nr:NAD(+) diphosphatase [Acidisoma silvae]MCB8874084.1 NAD(+) diphosphatase [Acidisoma silvae]
MRRTLVPQTSPFSRIHPSRPNVYTGSPLDRAAERRGDDDYIASLLASSQAVVAPIWRAQSLFHGEAVRFFSPADTVGWGITDQHWIFLGLWQEKPVFTLDLHHLEDPLTVLAVPDGTFGDIRHHGGLLTPDEASILAHARGLVHWQSRTRFCGVCGSACVPTSAGHVMHCKGCGTDHFPRSDPAVIMLVVKDDRVLLGHASRFKEGMYSTLAGFVEPGESLEEAVRREVFEETGVRVGAVGYHSSQPWPFPQSLMLGFYAEGLSEEITFHDAELDDARWFSRDMCRNPDAHGFLLPGPDSIARRLIEDWLAAGA